MGQGLSEEVARLVGKHLQAVSDNLEFADRLRQGTHSDKTTVGWAITSLFYSALHAVRAYLVARHGEHVTAHSDMRGMYHKYPELRRTQSSYDLLKQQSEAARYYLATFEWQHYDELRRDALKVRNSWEPKVRTFLPATPPAE